MGHSMASSVPGSHRGMQATARSVRRDQVWASATPGSREVPSPDGAAKGHTSFDDVVIVLSFLALIAIVVFGSAVMLLSWMSASLPVSSPIGGPAFDGGGVTGSDANGAVLVDDDWVDGPKLTR